MAPTHSVENLSITMDKLSLEATGVPLQQLPVNAVEPERDGRGMFHFVPPTLGRVNVLVEKPFNGTNDDAPW